jgi:hypothetical protein
LDKAGRLSKNPGDVSEGIFESVAVWRLSVECEQWRVDCPGCGGVHVEKLDWLVKNQRYIAAYCAP